MFGLYPQNLELSATIQALKSSKASILVALKNSDVGQLVASIKDHVDNMQVCRSAYTRHDFLIICLRL